VTEPRDIALFERDDQHTNTIVLSGVDVLVPLARDLDRDPLHDDEIRLFREDGHFERVLQAGHGDVEPNGATELVYRFRDVPPGLYRLSVRVGGEWTDVMTGLVVRRAGVFWNDQPLAEGPPPPPPEESTGGDEPEPEPADDERFALAADPFVDEL
jgi:hypothetical protein